MLRVKINYNNEFILPLRLNTGCVCNDDVADIKINEDGNFIFTLNDGNTYDLGQLIGESGIIYKPHIEKDEHNVFTFTIYDESSSQR